VIDLINDMLKATAVYWSPTKNAAGGTVTDPYNQITFNAPVEIKVFWIDTTEEFTTPNGEQRRAKSVVFADRDVEVGGMMIRGLIADLPTGMANTPRKIQGIGTVQRFDKIPTLDYDQFVRKAYL
jgi:hypothetical protein